MSMRISRPPVGVIGSPMMSEAREATPRDADKVVRHETNQAYNPVVATEEVAVELEISVDEAHELLDEAPRPRRRPSVIPTSGGRDGAMWVQYRRWESPLNGSGE